MRKSSESFLGNTCASRWKAGICSSRPFVLLSSLMNLVMVPTTMFSSAVTLVLIVFIIGDIFRLI